MLISKITSLLFLCNILRKKWVMQLIFCMLISMKSLLQIDTIILMGTVKYSLSSQNSKFAVPLQYLKNKKKVCDEADFLHANISFLQVDFNTLSIKIFYKVILSLLMGMIKHSQSTQSNKFAISLQYLKKEVRNGVHFLHADKHQNFYKLALSFLTEVARHVESTQIRKLVKFLEYIKKRVMQLLLCFIVMQNIQILYGVPVMFITCFWVVMVKNGCGLLDQGTLSRIILMKWAVFACLYKFRKAKC